MLARATDPAVVIHLAVLAGDLLDIASPVPLDAQITVVLHYLERLAARLPTVVCSGNHDLTSTDSGENSTALARRGPWARGRRRRRLARSRGLASDRVRVVGGSRTLAALEERLDAAAADRPAHWAWAFHDRPKARSRGPARGTPAIPSCLAFSTSTGRTSCCAGTSIRPRSHGRAAGLSVGTTLVVQRGVSARPRTDLYRARPDARTAGWRSATPHGVIHIVDTALAGDARPVVRRTVRARLDADRRALGDPVQQLTEDTEVVVAVAELPLHIGDVRRQAIEPSSELAGHLSATCGWAPRTRRVADLADDGRHLRGHRCRTRLVKQAPISPTTEPGRP